VFSVHIVSCVACVYALVIVEQQILALVCGVPRCRAVAVRYAGGCAARCVAAAAAAATVMLNL